MTFKDFIFCFPYTFCFDVILHLFYSLVSLLIIVATSDFIVLSLLIFEYVCSVTSTSLFQQLILSLYYRYFLFVAFPFPLRTL